MVALDAARKAQMLADLEGMQFHQISLRNLLPQGWTIQALCDLLIDGDLDSFPMEHQAEITAMLKPEWVQARRSERASLEMAEAMKSLTAMLGELLKAIQEMRPAPVNLNPGPPKRIQGK